MLLAIDIGNTHTVVGVFQNERLVADWRMTSHAYRTGDESWLVIKSFLENSGIDLNNIRGVGISSVVPNLTDIFEDLSTRFLRCQPLSVGSELDLGMAIMYVDPKAVGADRLCNAVAGFRKYGGPLIIIDFGTATTYDVVAKNGDYLGGVITLGLESSAGELHRRAARLPKIELHFPEKIIGRETVASMQAGIMYGTVEAVEGIVRRISHELGSKPRVIATGGLSGVIAQHTTIIEAIEPSLVLEGIRLIYERVRGKT
jgi:type III pantothenate kinase